jgi:long-chain acyl-CoA synthetase
MLASLATGATLVILEQGLPDSAATGSAFVFRSQRVFELIEQERVSLLPGSPYIFGVLAETPEDVPVDVSSLRLCMTAGNLLPEETFRRFKQRFGIPLRSIYGSTETGSIALNMEPDEDVCFDSVGRPCEGVEVRITDETLNEFPVGSIGEVAVRNWSMATGYLDMPELSREKFKDGFFFMGDLGKKDEQGRLYITGRKKIFIDSGGEKVDPWEIEQALLMHPAIKEAAVVGIPGPYGGEAIKAVIVAQGSLTELDLLLYCKSRLSDYKVPRIVEFRQELSRNILGKLVRKDLIAGQSLATSAASAQRDSILRSWIISALITGTESPEQLLIVRICEQVATLLQRDVVEIDPLRPLGEFGLGSLTAVELRDWLEASLELTIPVTLFWSYPTATAMATHLVTMLQRSLPPEQNAAMLALPTQERIEAQQAFYEVEHLSDAEVQRQIASMATEMWGSETMQGASTDDDLSSYLMQVEHMSDAEVQEILTQETIESRKIIHE